MARPFVPDSLKRRSVPVRLSKPQYRAFSAYAKVLDTTIQNLLRAAAEKHLQTLRQRVDESGINFPSEIALAEMSDDQFYDWLDNRKAPVPQVNRERRFSRRPARTEA
jgi:hypothetical protein